jgi:hypothetical protein
MRYRKMSLTITIATICLLFFPTSLRAEEQPEMVTDRPDFTESASAVPPRWVQLEMGAELGGSQTEIELGLPKLLVRAGVFRNFEARLEVPSITVLKPGQGKASADYGAAGLGMKYVVPLSDKAAIGVIAGVGIPVESAALKSDGLGAVINFLWAVDLSPSWSLGGNALIQAGGLAGKSPDTNVELDYAVSLSVGHSLTDKWGIYFESINQIDHQSDYRPALDAGLTYLVASNLQLDAYGGFDVTRTGEDWFAGLGASILL